MFDCDLFDYVRVAADERWVGAQEAVVESIEFAILAVLFEFQLWLGCNDVPEASAEPGDGRGILEAHSVPVAELVSEVPEWVQMRLEFA